jgi:CDGSH-type Zn-finger protein
MADPLPPVDPPGSVVVTVKPHGTIIVPKPVEVRDPEGTLIPIPSFKQPGVVKFCGCGRSGNKPFCDGSHKRAPAGTADGSQQPSSPG